MNTTTRRSGNRPLTDVEVEALLAINPALSIPGQRTPENATPRDNAHKTLIELFEDGVSIRSLAEALDRDRNNVNQHLLTARRRGFGTGQRRFIPRPPRPKQQRARTTRDLTNTERETLQAAYNALPDTPGSGRDWNTAQGRALVELIRETLDTNPRARQSEIADALGVSRQALNQRLNQQENTAA